MTLEKRLESVANDLRIALARDAGPFPLMHRDYVERLIDLLDEAAIGPATEGFYENFDDLADELHEAQDEIERLSFALQKIQELVHPSKAGGVGDAIRRVVEEALDGATRSTIEEVAKVEGAST